MRHNNALMTNLNDYFPCVFFFYTPFFIMQVDEIRLFLLTAQRKEKIYAETRMSLARGHNVSFAYR